MSNVPSEGLAASVAASLSKKAKAAAKKDFKRAAAPVTRPVKQGLHEARKWVDKTTSKVPVLGRLAALPLDLVDDVAQDILLEKKPKQKWRVPELVDKLPEPALPKAKTSATMVIEPNPGPPKKGKRGGKGGRRKKNAKKKGKKSLMGMLLRSKTVRRIRGARMTKGVQFRNKKTGAVSSGLKMKSSEYMWTTTLASGATNMGDEVISDGFLINPHELSLPELNIEVQRWELYRIRPHIKLESISNGTVDCELFGYFDPDPTDTIPSDPVRRLQIAETHGGTPGYVSKGHSWTPNSRRIRATSMKWFYCDPAGGTGADVRMADQYRFRLLVKRAPRLYGYNAGAASSGTVDLTINLRISYEIDFRNRTLDSVASSGTVRPQQITSAANLSSTTAYTGLAGSTVASVYTINTALPFIAPFIVANSGSADTLYKPFRPSCPKYVMLTLYNAATTLTGAPLPGLVNLTSIGTQRSVTGSNTNCTRLLYYVTSTFAKNNGTITSPCSVLGKYLSVGNNSLSINYLSAGFGTLDYNWAVNFGNWSTYSTGAAFSLEISEFNESNELALLERHGPCTVEGIAFSRYKQLDFCKRPDWSTFLKDFLVKREEKKDEIGYWKQRALGQEFAKDAKNESKWSLTPDNSDDEDDYKEFLEYKKTSHKKPDLGFFTRPLKIVQDDEKSEKGAPRPKVGSQK